MLKRTLCGLLMGLAVGLSTGPVLAQDYHISIAGDNHELLQRNKENAKAFYSMAFNDNKPKEAVEKYVGADYIQHNPLVKNGKQGFIAYFEKMATEYPGKKVEFKRAIAEGDFVVLHCYQTWPGDADYAGIDIFRFDENGKIVEHWDVIQKISGESVNQNSLF